MGHAAGEKLLSSLEDNEMPLLRKRNGLVNIYTCNLHLCQCFPEGSSGVC